jgi:hypothetical protein
MPDLTFWPDHRTGNGAIKFFKARPAACLPPRIASTMRSIEFCLAISYARCPDHFIGNSVSKPCNFRGAYDPKDASKNNLNNKSYLSLFRGIRR